MWWAGIPWVRVYMWWFVPCIPRCLGQGLCGGLSPVYPRCLGQVYMWWVVPYIPPGVWVRVYVVVCPLYTPGVLVRVYVVVCPLYTPGVWVRVYVVVCPLYTLVSWTIHRVWGLLPGFRVEFRNVGTMEFQNFHPRNG